jgi:hypothetical protein
MEILKTFIVLEKTTMYKNIRKVHYLEDGSYVIERNSKIGITLSDITEAEFTKMSSDYLKHKIK